MRTRPRSLSIRGLVLVIAMLGFPLAASAGKAYVNFNNALGNPITVRILFENGSEHSRATLDPGDRKRFAFRMTDMNCNSKTRGFEVIRRIDDKVTKVAAGQFGMKGDKVTRATQTSTCYVTIVEGPVDTPTKRIGIGFTRESDNQVAYTVVRD